MLSCSVGLHAVASVGSDFVAPWTVAHQAPLSKDFSRQEYWSGPSCPPPENSSTQGLNLRLMPPASSAGFFTTRATWETLLIEVVSEFFHGKDGILSRGWKLFVCWEKRTFGSSVNVIWPWVLLRKRGPSEKRLRMLVFMGKFYSSLWESSLVKADSRNAKPALANSDQAADPSSVSLCLKILECLSIKHPFSGHIPEQNPRRSPETRRSKEGLPWWSRSKASAWRCRGHWLDPTSGKMPRSNSAPARGCWTRTLALRRTASGAHAWSPALQPDAPAARSPLPAARAEPRLS